MVELPPPFAGLATTAVPAPEFDLALTLGSGQVFHWEREGAGWIGAIDEAAVYLEGRPGELIVAPAEHAAVASLYLALDHPLGEIRATFPAEDTHLAAACAACAGLRIIRQPWWECLATFITSALKQVAHIAAISHALRRRYGRPLPLGDRIVHAYPTPARLAALEESDLRALGLGFRAPKLLATARRVAAGECDFTALAGVPRVEAERILRALPGVGPKVANCALLFAGGYLDAFPVDVWIERVLLANYFARRRRPPRAGELEQFAARHFGPYGGYAQQYLFHHARTGGRKPSE